MAAAVHPVRGDAVVITMPCLPAMPVKSDESDAVRRLRCRNYNACLTVARDENWVGFACPHRCDAYAELTLEEQRSDADAMARMLNASLKVNYTAIYAGHQRAKVAAQAKRMACNPQRYNCACGNTKHPNAKRCDPCRWAAARGERQ